MEKKTVKTNRRKYDADFKKEVIKMIESGRTVPDVAQSLGIGTNLIYYWCKRAKNAPFLSGSDISLDSDKIAMQKRIRELEQERDILKKALGIFSR